MTTKRWGARIAIGLLSLWLAGCGGDEPGLPPPDVASAAARAPLRVLVLDDAPLAEVIARQWQARARSPVQVRHAASSELTFAPDSFAADVVIYPAGLLGSLVGSDLVLPVPEHVLDDPALDRQDILPFDRGPIVSWGKTVYAFSFGSPCLTLLYRADLFGRLGLAPPRSWTEYQELAVRLGQQEALGDLAPPPDAPWSGTAEPLAAGWAGQVLLARAAVYARSRSRFSTLFNYKTMQPLIDREPFVRALDELVAAAGSAPGNASELTPDDARQAILQGRCAMALSWPAPRLDDAEAAPSTQRLELAFAPLPGSDQVFNFMENRWERRGADESPVVPLLAVAGRLGSVIKTSRNRRTAWSLLATLTSKQLSGRVATRSRYTTPFRSSHLAKVDDWIGSAFGAGAAEQYAEILRTTHDRTLWVFSMRIPGRTEYLAALDDAVHQALAGTASRAALRSAADRWRKITQRLGVQSQRDAYARSLGLAR